MGVYCYADDFCLLSRTYTELQIMFKICEHYTNKHISISLMPKRVNYCIAVHNFTH